MDLTHAIADALGDFRPDAAPLVPALAAADPLGVPRGACPKCIAPRNPTARACPSCGLEFERFHASRVEPTAALLQSFAWLQAGGGALDEHLRLLARAELLGELPQLVRLYRIWLAREPDNAIAQHVVQEAVKLASARLMATPSATKNPRQRNLVVFLVVVMFLATVTIKTISTLH